MKIIFKLIDNRSFFRKVLATEWNRLRECQTSFSYLIIITIWYSSKIMHEQRVKTEDQKNSFLKIGQLFYEGLVSDWIESIRFGIFSIFQMRCELLVPRRWDGELFKSKPENNNIILKYVIWVQPIYKNQSNSRKK